MKLTHLHINGFPFGSFSMLVVVRRHYETLWHSFGDFSQSSGLVIAQDSISYNCNTRYHLTLVLEKIVVK